MQYKPALIISLAVFALVGCSTSPEIVPAGPDTYSVSAGGGLGWTPSSAPIRAKVYRAANDFCAERGLIMVPVSVDQRPGEMGRHTASMELVFRALRPGDPEIERPTVEKPDYIQRTEVRH